MTDNEVTLEPVGYLYKHPRHPDEWGTIRLTPGDKKSGWTEIPLYTEPAISSGGEVERLVNQISDEDLRSIAESKDVSQCRGRIATALAAMDRAPGDDLPADVVRLVIAARIVAFEDQGPDAIAELDKASEAFAERVLWDNEPAQPKPRPVEAGEVENADLVELLAEGMWAESRKRLGLAAQYLPKQRSDFRKEASAVLLVHRQQSLSAARAEIEDGEITIGTKCDRCGMMAPKGLADEYCNRPECEHRAALSTDQGEG